MYVVLSLVYADASSAVFCRVTILILLSSKLSLADASASNQSRAGFLIIKWEIWLWGKVQTLLI